MLASCPISSVKIDANIARINSLFITLGTIAFLYTHWSIFVGLLFGDFFIRFFIKPKYSYITFLSKIIKKLLNIQTKMTDYAPKRLAAFFGLLFSATITITNLIGYESISMVFSYILLFCSSLELFFNYCLGCQIYYLYQYIKKI